MQDSALLDELRILETALHCAEVRADRARVAELLDEQFWEIGRSGKLWTREATLAEFENSAPQYTIWAQEFKLERLGPAVALLTYRSAHVTQTGELERHSLRASIWVLNEMQWRMRFHQGTAAEAFEKHAT